MRPWSPIVPDFISPLRNRIAADYNFIRGDIITRLYDRDETKGPYHGTIENGAWVSNNDALIFNGINTGVDLGVKKLGNTALFTGSVERFTIFAVAKVPGGIGNGGTFIGSGSTIGATRIFRQYIQESSGTYSLNIRGVISNNLFLNDGEWHCFSFRWNGVIGEYRVDRSSPIEVPVGTAPADESVNLTLGRRPQGSEDGLTGEMAQMLVLDSALSMADWDFAINQLHALMDRRGYGFLRADDPNVGIAWPANIRALIVADYTFRKGFHATRFYDDDNQHGPYHGDIVNGRWISGNSALEFVNQETHISTRATFGSTGLVPSGATRWGIVIVAKADIGGGGTLFDKGQDASGNRQIRLYLRGQDGNFAVNLRGNLNLMLGENRGFWYAHSIWYDGTTTRYMRNLDAPQVLTPGAGANANEILYLGARSDLTRVNGFVGTMTYNLILAGNDVNEARMRAAVNVINERVANRGLPFLSTGGGTGNDPAPTEPTTQPLSNLRDRIGLDYDHVMGANTSLLYDRDSRVGPFNGAITNAIWSGKTTMLIYDGTGYVNTNRSSVGTTSFNAVAGAAFHVFVVSKVYLDDTGGTLFDKGADAQGVRRLRIFHRASDGNFAVTLRGSLNLMLGANDGEWHCHSIRWNGTTAHYRRDLGALQTLTVGAADITTDPLFLGARSPDGSAGWW